MDVTTSHNYAHEPEFSEAMVRRLARSGVPFCQIALMIVHGEHPTFHRIRLRVEAICTEEEANELTLSSLLGGTHN